MSDDPMTWEKEAVVSALEPMNVIKPMEMETKSATDLNFKVDLLAVVDEEIQSAEKALSHLYDEYEDLFSNKEYDLGSTDIRT